MIWPIDWQNPGDQQTVTTLLVSLPEMPVIFRALDIAKQADSVNCSLAYTCFGLLKVQSQLTDEKSRHYWCYSELPVLIRTLDIA